MGTSQRRKARELTSGCEERAARAPLSPPRRAMHARRPIRPRAPIRSVGPVRAPRDLHRDRFGSRDLQAGLGRDAVDIYRCGAAAKLHGREMRRADVETPSV
jgi:hypothetical protein